MAGRGDTLADKLLYFEGVLDDNKNEHALHDVTERDSDKDSDASGM